MKLAKLSELPLGVSLNAQKPLLTPPEGQSLDEICLCLRKVNTDGRSASRSLCLCGEAY